MRDSDRGWVGTSDPQTDPLAVRNGRMERTPTYQFTGESVHPIRRCPVADIS